MRLTYRGEHFAFVTPRRTLPLLAYLLVRRSQPVMRDFLAFALWPDEDEEHARDQLRRNLSLLQKALPPPLTGRPWIAVEPDAIRWNAAAGAWLDVAEFERLSAVAEHRADAVSVYGGELLEALDEEWLGPERERLHTLFLDDLATLVRTHRARREFAPAIEYAQRALAADPLREDIARQLIAVRYESGDRAGALQEFERFSDRLRDELGVDPMPETLALWERIGSDDAADDLEPEPAAAIAAPSSQPLAGRRHEREALATLWSRAARGRGRSVFVAGPAGIGKTRLLEELALIADAEGGRVVRGSCGEPERAPYAGLIDALRSNLPLVTSLKVSPIWLAALARVIPELAARRADLPPLPALDPERERTRLLEAFATVIVALGKSRPLLLALDDVHSAGEATAQAIAFVARRAADARVLVACAYRDDDVTRAHPLRKLRRALLDEGIAETLAPRPLDADEARDFVAALVPELPASAIEALYARSEGNPLFLRELVREAKAGRSPSVDLPASVRELVQTRVESLSESARAFAESAAVAGGRFDLEIVRDLIGWQEHEIDEALSELQDRGIVREPRDRARNQFVFMHQLVQAAIYELSEPLARLRRHRRLAEVLESATDGSPSAAGEIARHFTLGEQGDRSVPYYLLAARGAAESFANEEGLRLATSGVAFAHGRNRNDLLLVRELLLARRGERAAQRADLREVERALEPGDRDRHCELLSRFVELARVTGDVEDESARVAALRAAADGLPLWEATALLSDARLLRRTGKFDDALAAARAAFNRFAEARDTRAFAALASFVGSAADAGRFGDGAALLESGRAVARDDASRAMLAMTAIDFAFARYDFGSVIARCEEAVGYARTIGDRELESLAYERLGLACTYVSTYDRARAALDRSLTIAMEIDHPRRQANALLDLSVLFLRFGAYDASSAVLDRAEPLYARLGSANNVRSCRLNRAENELHAGRPERGRELALAVLDDARRSGHLGIEAAALGTLGCCERVLGNSAAAMTILRQAIDARAKLDQQPNLDDLAELARAAAESGDIATAQASVGELLRLLSGKTSVESADIPRCLAAAAATSISLGDAEGATSLIQRGRAALEERAARIEDEAVRAGYLGLAHNRWLASASGTKRNAVAF